MASAVARGIEKSSFYHSFGRPTMQHEVTKGLPVQLKNLHFTTVLDVRRARSDERVARAHREFAFHHSFGRPTMTFCVKGCLGHVKICISPQSWASDDHFLRQGLLRRRENLHFTTVLGVRRSLFALRVASAT